MQYSGSLMFKLQSKLGHMLKQIRNQCLHHKKSHGINQKDLSEKLVSLGQRVYNMESGHDYLQSITSMQPNLEKGFLYWKQRMKNQWTLLGDCPSHLLYTKIKKQKSRNKIISLRDAQGNWATEPHDIMNIVQEFWSSVFLMPVLLIVKMKHNKYYASFIYLHFLIINKLLFLKLLVMRR